MIGKRLIAAAAFLVAGAAVANAADLPPTIVTPSTPVTVPAPPTFNWNRFYVGAYGGAWFGYPPVAYDSARVGVTAGRNVQFNRFVFGLEAEIGAYDFTGLTFEAYGVARLGVLATDNLLLYGLAGIGHDGAWPGILNSMILGGGAEYAVSSNLSIVAQAAVWKSFGSPFDYLSLTGGLNWHFGP